jgi:hypothetical protein
MIVNILNWILTGFGLIMFIFFIGAMIFGLVSGFILIMSGLRKR